MTDSEFLYDLQDCYSGKYSDKQSSEIYDLIETLDSNQIKNLYNYIRNTHNLRSLPDRPHIYKSMQVLGYIKKKIPTNSSQLHPQSPYQMVLKYKNKPISWLVEMCKKIQSIDSDKLSSARISFNYCWNYLLCVEPDFRNLMRDHIINQDYNKIYNLIDNHGVQINERIENVKVKSF